MSGNQAIELDCPDGVGTGPTGTLSAQQSRDLGGFEVRRALPALKRQMVGPLPFFDRAGPAEWLISQGIDVRSPPGWRWSVAVNGVQPHCNAAAGSLGGGQMHQSMDLRQAKRRDSQCPSRDHRECPVIIHLDTSSYKTEDML